MARAAIRLDDAQDGRWPPICVVTGVPAKGRRPKQFVSAPDWTWAVLLLSAFWWLLSLFGASRDVTVKLPVAGEHVSVRKVKGHLRGDWLWLRGVHPDFAAALGRQYAHLPPAERPI